MSGKPKCAFAAVPERAVDDKRLGNAGFRVLAALCSYADKDGHCFPGLGTIGGRLGITRQAVQRQVRHLKSLGYVNVEKRARPNGSGTTNRSQDCITLADEQAKATGTMGSPDSLAAATTPGWA